MSDQIETGTVLSFDPEKGFGRLKDSQDREYFVHFRDIIGDDHLEEGDPVQFVGRLHRKGNIAQEVRKA